MFPKQEPVILSAGWESGTMGSRSSVARHEWKGLTKMAPGRLEDYLERQRLQSGEVPQSQRMRIPGSFDEQDEE